QEYYALANNLILTGTRFPSKVTGNTWRNIRLASMDGGYVFFAGGTGNWTPTRVDDILPFNVLAGRRYKIGLVQFELSNASEKKLISNEVEFLLLMNLDSVTPNPVPQGTTVVEVITANELGPQGSKKVKFGNHQAQVVQWGGAAPLGGKFKVRVPPSLARPGVYELYVEENGIAVSRRVQVRLLSGRPD
ncbi:MAG: hypothetical protein OEW18_07265, partial [Candidatus Aminicenantes bacterium]|nr:hypothetical protein [Candidatus Aminicenantes bacterium]